MRKLLVASALLAVAIAIGVPAAVADARGRSADAPAQQCRAERRADPQAFRETYAGARGRHALARCVKAKLEAGRKERKHPAPVAQPEATAHRAPAQPQVPPPA